MIKTIIVIDYQLYSLLENCLKTQLVGFGWADVSGFTLRFCWVKRHVTKKEGYLNKTSPCWWLRYCNSIFHYVWQCYNKFSNFFRGGKKILTTPTTLAKYPTSAWYTNIDQSCKYSATDGCQVTEYIWLGFSSYSGK